MAEQIYDYALTNLERVKTRLSIGNTDFDTLLIRLINAATDIIENTCHRRFLSTVYTNELHSVYTDVDQFVLLNQSPVTALTSFQYRLGIPSMPSWTDYPAIAYELSEDGKSGLIRLYTSPPRGSNTVRASYTAGYLIDFTNFGNTSKHNLPADLTEACERMTVKAFKRREAEGKTREVFDGAQVMWSTDLDEDIKDILARHTRLEAFI